MKLYIQKLERKNRMHYKNIEKVLRMNKNILYNKNKIFYNNI
jgi:hypothetical protein